MTEVSAKEENDEFKVDDEFKEIGLYNDSYEDDEEDNEILLNSNVQNQNMQSSPQVSNSSSNDIKKVKLIIIIISLFAFFIYFMNSETFSGIREAGYIIFKFILGILVTFLIILGVASLMEKP